MADAQQLPQASTNPKLPFMMRLKAWWNGYDLEVKEAASDGSLSDDNEGQPQLSWDEIRIELSQEIWGQGCSSPAQESFVLGLLRAVGLSPAMTVLELGAGLGGAGRFLVKNFGCWMTCLEKDQALVDAGQDASLIAGLAKKAPVEAYDPETIELKPKAYDCVFTLGGFFTVEDKERLLQQIDGSLKERGQFLFTDFVKRDNAGESAALEDWMTHEPEQPNLWTAKDYSRFIESQGYDVRVVADVSDDFKAMILKGWTTFLSSFGEKGLDQAKAQALVNEVELWMRRTQALDSGDLRVYRFHAIKTS